MRASINAWAAGLALLCAPASARAEWVTSWAAAPMQPAPELAALVHSPSYADRTLSQTIRISAGGSAVRLRLSNAYGTRPLRIGGARVAILDAEGREKPGTARTLTFAGAAGATIARGAPLLSDPATLDLPDLARLSVQLYLPEDTGPCTCHSPGLDALSVSPPGNFLGRAFEPAERGTHRAFLASVEVDAPGPAATLAVLGDSISDGVGSTSGADRRWPDLLAERLAARGGRRWGVANQGISGNRVLADGFGESALARLDRDILSLPGLKALVVFEGVNDLGMAFGDFSRAPPAMRTLAGPKIDAEAILAGYRQIVARARVHGIRVYGATIAPYGGSALWTPEGESARQAVNAAIRAGGIFDAVLDFDAVLRDSAHPERMREGYQSGDHLHGSDAGYRALAASIDLTLFGE